MGAGEVPAESSGWSDAWQQGAASTVFTVVEVDGEHCQHGTWQRDDTTQGSALARKGERASAEGGWAGLQRSRTGELRAGRAPQRATDGVRRGEGEARPCNIGLGPADPGTPGSVANLYMSAHLKTVQLLSSSSSSLSAQLLCSASSSRRGGDGQCCCRCSCVGDAPRCCRRGSAY